MCTNCVLCGIVLSFTPSMQHACVDLGLAGQASLFISVLIKLKSFLHEFNPTYRLGVMICHDESVGGAAACSIWPELADI